MPRKKTTDAPKRAKKTPEEAKALTLKAFELCFQDTDLGLTDACKQIGHSFSTCAHHMRFDPEIKELNHALKLARIEDAPARLKRMEQDLEDDLKSTEVKYWGSVASAHKAKQGYFGYRWNFIMRAVEKADDDAQRTTVLDEPIASDASSEELLDKVRTIVSGQ